MEKMGVLEYIDLLQSAEMVPAEVWHALLTGLSREEREVLSSKAREVALENFGNGVYVRALIEISSCCRNNCNYCGLRCSNREVARYRLSKEEILDACSHAAAYGFNTFVLQGGEDPAMSDEWLADVVEAIKTRFPEKAVTLSVGERSREGYEMLHRAGADRYLLRHETASEEHYAYLHPETMSFANRMESLYLLKELGFQVGSGMMVGSPGQGVEELVADLCFLDELKPQMIGIGPFIPAAGTPFAASKPGSADETLLLISLLRLRFPKALIPATTALATLCDNGTEKGILAGANVVMPNFTPIEVRGKYSIYNNKKCNGSESGEHMAELGKLLDEIGYRIDYSRGDYNMYNSRSTKASEFICDEEIRSTLSFARENCGNKELVDSILEKARSFKGLTHREAALLLECDDKSTIEKIYALANEIKHRFYGNRIVMFAPLYLSNYCVNGCVYCPYHAKNRQIRRKKLTQEEIKAEVMALQDMGHKRLALEAGEHPLKNPIEYILESIKTIYGIKHKNGAIRRVNVNIAATTVENYRRLRDAGIGTYILFQETYNKVQYEALHPTGPKSDYAYHTEAMDRAMQGGIDDVGIGVLFGLETYRYDFVGLLMHAEHLEATYGVGPHTISVPRLCKADDVDTDDFKNAVPDEMFYRIVAVIRIAVPYTGMIISTRESEKSRKRLLSLGISQISGGSRTSVGGYVAPEREEENSSQFDIADHRSLDEVVGWLLDLDHIPSFCTACYREGRTGDRFMTLLKNGLISNCCLPNALLTLKEYIRDYASPATREKGERMIRRLLGNIPNEKVRLKAEGYLDEIENGKRDFRF